jgi:hypothetical protein
MAIDTWGEYEHLLRIRRCIMICFFKLAQVEGNGKPLPYFSEVMQLLLSNLLNGRHVGILSSKIFQK